jgi:hypothetical protein
LREVKKKVFVKSRKRYMAKKKLTYDNGHICDDCVHCEWHTQYWNLDPLGQPITFGCKLGIFEHGEIRGKKACAKWEHK